MAMCSENDVAAIDVNMGCPKEFSIKVEQHYFVMFPYVVCGCDEWYSNS